MVEAQKPEKLPIPKAGPLGEGWVSAEKNVPMSNEPKADAKSRDAKEWNTNLQEGWHHDK